MGFKEAIIPNQSLKSDLSSFKNIKVIKMKTISDCIKYIFSNDASSSKRVNVKRDFIEDKK